LQLPRVRLPLQSPRVCIPAALSLHLLALPFNLLLALSLPACKDQLEDLGVTTTSTT